MIDLGDVAVFEFAERTTIRLISTAYIDEPAISPLADDDDELSVLEDIEMMTSARHNTLAAVPSGVSPDELLSQSHGYAWTYINAAFCYTTLTGNRFSAADRGAWYASFGPNATETSQAEVSYHLTRELENVGIFENVTAYRELRAGFMTDMHDLRKFSDEVFLIPETESAYPAGQALAKTILQAGGNGVLYPSVRYPAGQCLAAFRPHIIQNVSQGQTWRFEWSGQHQPTISRL